jgi:hypothetical protein
VGLWTKTVTIVTVLASFVARNRDKRAQVVAFQLRENFPAPEKLEPLLVFGVEASRRREGSSTGFIRQSLRAYPRNAIRGRQGREVPSSASLGVSVGSGGACGMLRAWMTADMCLRAAGLSCILMERHPF